MEDMLRVGVITSTHGLNGEVKVYPTTDDPSRFDVLEEVWVSIGRDSFKLHVDHVRYFKQFVIVHFRELKKIEDVMPYLKKDLMVTRDQAVPLEENEYFIADLLNLKVEDENGTELGILDDVLQTGANDVYVVKREEREILIPAIHQCILKIDIPAGKMTVRLMEGME